MLFHNFKTKAIVFLTNQNLSIVLLLSELANQIAAVRPPSVQSFRYFIGSKVDNRLICTIQILDNNQCISYPINLQVNT